MTPDEQLRYCEKTDRAFKALLGSDLTTATWRLGAIVLVVCAVGAAVSVLAA